MPRLAEAGMVEASKGKYGGYQLTRSVEEIYLYQIIEVGEGWDLYRQCLLGFEECSEKNPCPIHSHWKAIKDRIEELFSTLTLKDLLKDASHMEF